MGGVGVKGKLITRFSWVDLPRLHDGKHILPLPAVYVPGIFLRACFKQILKSSSPATSPVAHMTRQPTQLGNFIPASAVLSPGEN